MNIHLLQRLQLLLQLVKDDRLCVTARENLAAAKELVDTAHMLEDIDNVEYRHYRSLCIHAHIDTANHELERARADLPKTYNSFDDGVRAVQVSEPDLLTTLTKFREAFVIAAGDKSPFCKLALAPVDEAIAKARGES